MAACVSGESEPMSSALIVIDMLNPYEHEDADELAANVARIVEPLTGLIARAREAGIELVYVNDHYGDFAASRDDLVERALAGRHRELVEPVVPPDDCAFLPKVRHSAFYSTTLEYLLGQRQVESLILAGQVTEQCILYTALDAYVRHFEVCVPRDAVAPIDGDLGEAALRMMARNMRAAVVTAADALSEGSAVTRAGCD
jgi:nicotinamidase-related amidase